MRLSKIFLLCLLVLVVATQSCSPPAQSVTPQVITVVVTAVPSQPGKTPDVGASATPLPPSPTAQQKAAESATATSAPGPTAGPQCTTLQAVSFLNGPGLAYPALGVLAPGKTLIPTGYSPVGSPGGAWLQVSDPSNQRVGWISAEAQFVKCTITPTTLPVVAVSPPPPPPAPVVSNLPAQGPQGGDIDFGVVMSPDYLMRITARKHGSSKDGDGIDHVLFIIKKKNSQVYKNNETAAKYCIFMGGEPDCNPWTKANGRYFWPGNGPEIVSGDYQATIRVALKTDPSNESEWTFQITIKLP